MLRTCAVTGEPLQAYCSDASCQFHSLKAEQHCIRPSAGNPTVAESAFYTDMTVAEVKSERLRVGRLAKVAGTLAVYAEFSQQNGGYLNRDANYIPVNWNDILDSSGLTESFVTEVLANTAMWDAFTAQFQTTLAQHEVLFQQKTKDSK